jgi:predicted small lipoprotein YifL
MKKNFALVFVVLLIFGFAGCGGKSALVGKWVPEDGQNISGDFIEERLEFKKDGTGIGDGFTLAWTAEKGRITLKLDIGFGYAYDYKISGSTLTLTDDKGESVKYKKE